MGALEDLLDLLRPRDPRRERLLSERVRPALSATARAMAGRPAAEVAAALEAVVRDAGGRPDRRAVAELAARVERGEDPFA